jgi:diadenosine tetraphosphatase ApaH/serine/threonine PP2A family protein phosphatase
VLGPWPAECVSRLRDVGGRFLTGNCERQISHGTDETERWCRDQLDEATLTEIGGWPLTLTVDVDGVGPALFCHGSPRSDDEILTRITPGAVVEEACGGAPFVVCGHTHVQYDRRAGGTRVVNAGSVGMPYEGRAAAYWALLGPEVALVSTEYDVERVAAAIGETGYPSAGELVETLLMPHSADEATSVFEARREAWGGGA